MSVGVQVRKARREHLGLTQRELAALLDIDSVNVSRWERGVAEPKLRYVRQLAQLAELPLTWFYVDEKDEAAA